MKISRFKKSQKILTFFSTNFEYREPYQILIDATFCQAALQNKIIIEEQLKKYFQTPVKLLTTQCIILEAESLGMPLTGATMIVKQFHVHKCGHEGKPISASNCIKSMTKISRYIVASQDRALQESLRKIPGRCLLYLHKATPVLEPPSDASKKYVVKKSQNLTENVERQIEHLKKAQGLPSRKSNTELPKKKRKGHKNPNPLSCKKSKKDKLNPQVTTRVANQSKTPLKAKRKRIKIPQHVRETLKSL